MEILMLGVFVWILITIGIARHANAHEKSPFLWFFAVGIFGPFGLIFYSISLASEAHHMASD